MLEKPENEVNCFETTEHKGVFFDGKEVLKPGRMGSRVGFIMNDVHYQVQAAPPCHSVYKCAWVGLGPPSWQLGGAVDSHVADVDAFPQVISWGFRFTGVKESKGGKFLLLVDGWETQSRRPINQFFRSLYMKVNPSCASGNLLCTLQVTRRAPLSVAKVLLQGVMLLALSMVGVAAIIFAHNKIVSSWVARIFLVLLPLGAYYLYVGVIGVLK